MADSSCIGCRQAITQQQANDENTINIAKQMAKEKNIIVGLYTDDTGRLCIATEPGYPVTRYISPQLQNVAFRGI